MDDVEGLYRQLIDAWNANDGAAMATCFADDGEMIGFDGSHVSGRTNIETEMSAIFKDHQTATYVAKVHGVRKVGGSDVVLLHAHAGMVPPGGSEIKPDVNTHHIVVAENVVGEWRIVLFQNTPAQFHGWPELVQTWTEELQDLL